jgi:hypothetical protein
MAITEQEREELLTKVLDKLETIEEGLDVLHRTTTSSVQDIECEIEAISALLNEAFPGEEEDVVDEDDADEDVEPETEENQNG